MEAKLIEIRDAATAIPAIVVRMDSNHVAERYWLGRQGYLHVSVPWVLMMPLTYPEFHSDPNTWASRTFRIAHEYVQIEWDNIETGDIVDVEFILGKSKEPKISERLEK